MADKKQEIDKAIASINKGVDKKEEMRLMMAPYANWDSFLLSAPLSIALLGQLILISSDADFSLQDKFKFLKYPDSFRACLVQISNKFWNVFNKAHTSMDQIRLYSSNVDNHVKTAVKFLVAGSAEEVGSMVPCALQNIEWIADDSIELAMSVEEEFVSVMKLMAELLEACIRGKDQHENDLKAAKITREFAEVNMKAVQEKKEQIKQTLVKGIRALRELREQWGKLVEFFQMLSNIVKCCLSTSLKNFVQTSQDRLTEEDSGMSALMRDVIFEQAFQANQIAYEVNSISSMYVEVSHQYLMERITCLGKLIAPDPASDAHEIRLKQNELNRGCKEAQEAIRRIAFNKKKEMTEAIDKRIADFVKANIPMSKADVASEVDDLC